MGLWQAIVAVLVVQALLTCRNNRYLALQLSKQSGFLTFIKQLNLTATWHKLFTTDRQRNLPTKPLPPESGATCVRQLT
jgi:hypothetical protein